MRDDRMCCEDCYELMPGQFEFFGHVTYCEHRSPEFILYHQPPWQMEKYLGKRCAVVLNNINPVQIQVGVLVELEIDGNCVIDDDNGVRHYCWPALEIRPAATLEIGDYFSRCSHCNGNANPNEQRHFHGGPGSGYQKGSSLDDRNGCKAIFVDKLYVYARGLHGSTGQ